MSPAETVGQFLTIREVERKLGVSRSTVYRFMLRGLPYVQLGGVRRISETDLQDWLAQQTETGAPPPGVDEDLPPSTLYRCLICAVIIEHDGSPLRACPKCRARTVRRVS